MDTEKRLLSLDALRGFDMLFIMGFASLVVACCALFPGGADCWLARQMEHVSWDGLRHHDTIFPLFLYLAGLSFPFSYAKQVARGRTRSQIYGKIFYRGFALVVLGCIYNGFLQLKFPFRYMGVLQHIGLAWMFAALLFINCKTKTRVWIAAAILVGYYLLLRFVGAPDHPGADPFSYEGNLVGYVDRVLNRWFSFMHGRLYRGDFDPEGVLSILPAIVTAMLGMFTGEYVRKPESEVSGGKKTVTMLVAAAVMLVVGLLWSLQFPINKALWSSTFVLVVGAYSVAMFALFYWIIDVKGWKKWTTFFTVIGMNSITIYMGQRIINFRSIGNFFVGGIASLGGEAWANFIGALGYLAVSWLFLYFLYRKKVFLKV
ncbi:MAG: DUF5009 domain-containing protein [Bacteroidales bacterium]|nr:DUF5009 domain-containing protein [Bacteroidales bacterium]